MDGGGLTEAALAVARTTGSFQWPQFDTAAWLQFILLITMLILCALTSASETALTSVSRIKLKNLVEEGDQKAAEIERILTNPNVFLSAILIFNSVATIVASSLATLLALVSGVEKREAVGKQQCRADSLSSAGREQQAEAGCERAKDRSDREQAGTDEQQAASSEVIAERASKKEQRR